MPIRARAEPGHYVLIACRDVCRVRANARFSIVRRADPLAGEIEAGCP